DDERFTVWKKASVYAGFESMQELLSGYITHVRPVFSPGENYLEIWIMDASVRLDREEKRKAWPNKTDSDIAGEILNENGFTPQVEDTAIVHDEKVSTIMQRETDLKFLQRLARRNGFQFYVQEDKAYFCKLNFDTPLQPVLAYNFGEETNLDSFHIEVNGLTAANVGAFQVDPLVKTTTDIMVLQSDQAVLGRVKPEEFSAAGVPQPLTMVSMNAVTGNVEMGTLCRSIFDRGQWFVTAEGTIPANIYGHVLEARKNVTVKGIGETYSGVYHITHVTHSFTGSGYVQRFRAQRNALMVTGTEVFV
ncbi:MAG: phage late control D family protein, partial [Candidatus Aminicenantes bacterium]|nr:phage late control D family protein [Candidatus Aminicenantes bacterium]